VDLADLPVDPMCLIATPNPASGSVMFTYSAPGNPNPSPTRLRLHDSSGRLIRDLTAQADSFGTGRVTWDGRDEGGKPVAQGIYFCRWVLEGKALTRRLVVIR